MTEIVLRWRVEDRAVWPVARGHASVDASWAVALALLALLTVEIALRLHAQSRVREA